MALMRGVAKHLFEAAESDPKAIDLQFVERYTAGFEAYQALVVATSWEEIERQSGVPTAQIREMGEVYRKSRSAIISWCLGVTQQEHAGDTIREIVNVLLLRGNIGREGAGSVPDPRALERARQSHLRHRPPSERGLARPHGQGLRHHVATGPRARHRPRHPGDDARRREGIRGHGRELRPRRPRPGLHLPGASELRPDRPGEHQAQPQPPRPRPRRPDPAVPRAYREGPRQERVCKGSPSRTR